MLVRRRKRTIGNKERERTEESKGVDREKEKENVCLKEKGKVEIKRRRKKKTQEEAEHIIAKLYQFMEGNKVVFCHKKYLKFCFFIMFKLQGQMLGNCKRKFISGNKRTRNLKDIHCNILKLFFQCSECFRRFQFEKIKH